MDQKWQVTESCFQLKHCKTGKKLSVSLTFLQKSQWKFTQMYEKIPPCNLRNPIILVATIIFILKTVLRGLLDQLQITPLTWLIPNDFTCRNNLWKTPFFPLVGVEALEGAVHLPVQLLPGSFLDRTVYHACCFNSYFNSITDGVSACAWCQRCFLILPRTSDGSRSSSFWKAVNRKLAYFLHYNWTSIGTTKKPLQLPNEMYPLRMYTLRMQRWSGSRHVLNLEPLQWNAQQTNEEGAGAGQLAVVALPAACQQNRVCNILCHRSGAW